MEPGLSLEKTNDSLMSIDKTELSGLGLNSNFSRTNYAAQGLPIYFCISNTYLFQMF